MLLFFILIQFYFTDGNVVIVNLNNKTRKIFSECNFAKLTFIIFNNFGAEVN